MLNIYRFHSTPDVLDDYKQQAPMKMVVAAIESSMKHLREHLHMIGSYGHTSVGALYNVLRKHVDDFEFSQTEYDTISLNFGNVTGEFIVTDQVVKGYVNDKRVADVLTMKLGYNDVSELESEPLNDCINKVLQHIADELEKNNA